MIIGFIPVQRHFAVTTEIEPTGVMASGAVVLIPTELVRLFGCDYDGWLYYIDNSWFCRFLIFTKGTFH